jgi:L-lysine exporter family protein LysE/ArgO
MISAFIHGFILTLVLSLPLGPVNMFLITSSARVKNISSAMLLAAIISICDSATIIFAVLGVSEVLTSLPWLKSFFIGTGVIFLSYMGAISCKSSQNNEKLNSINYPQNFWKQIFFCIALIWCNPLALMEIFGIIGTTSLSYPAREKVAFTAGCVVNSWLWFMSIAIVGNLLTKYKHYQKILSILNIISAFVMWGSALILLRELFQ